MQSTAGALAFTKHFFSLINQAWMKPEAGLLPHLYTPSCKSCQGFEDNATRFVREGLKYNKTPFEILEVSTYGPATPGSTQLTDITTHQAAASIVDANGRSVEQIPEVRGDLVATVTWQQSDWKITSIKVLK